MSPMPTPELQREYQRQWQKRRREAWFSGKCCASCGATTTLELDHIDPDTRGSHRIWSWSQTRRDEELSKCQVLCYECHKAKSGKEKATGAAHGRARLSEDDVKEIRALYAQGVMSQYDLANRYSVGQRTICDIIRRVTWKHAT